MNIPADQSYKKYLYWRSFKNKRQGMIRTFEIDNGKGYFKED